MNNYISKVLKKIDKLSAEQIRSLVQQLLDENSRYAMILNSYQDAMIACSNDYVPWYVNKAALRYFKIGKLKKKLPIWSQVGLPTVSEFLRQNLLANSYSKNKATLSVDQIVFLIKIFPLVGEGKIQGWLIWATDLTHEHRQNSLRHGHESLSQLANMSAILAHEIRNPLTAISIHLQLIQAYRKEMGHDKDIDECVRIITEEVHHLNAVTSHFLSTANPVEISPGQQDLADIVLRTAKFLEPELEDHAIKMQLKISPGPIEMMVDESLIRLAMVNLMRNAMAAISHEDGEIIIQVHEEENYAEISISDNGMGIPIIDQEKIFSPYYTTKKDGSGLGLTVVYKVVREHNGSLSVNSPSRVFHLKKNSKHPGTDFVIRLPKVVHSRPMLTLEENFSE